MHYLTVENLSKSFGVDTLFSGITFHMEEGDKIALVARNGSGKSTLLRILAGRETPDGGKVWLHRDVLPVFLEQDPAFLEDDSVLDNIFHHDHPVMNAIRDYEAACDDGVAEAINAAIVRMDELGAWDFDAKVRQILGRLEVRQLHQQVGTLSGGQRKRVALARTLIDIGFEKRHVLLIMDEPTNHLDLESIQALNNALVDYKGIVLFHSHDQEFINTIANRIIEITPHGIIDRHMSYEEYAEDKAIQERRMQLYGS